MRAGLASCEKDQKNPCGSGEPSHAPRIVAAPLAPHNGPEINAPSIEFMEEATAVQALETKRDQEVEPWMKLERKINQQPRTR